MTALLAILCAFNWLVSIVVSSIVNERISK